MATKSDSKSKRGAAGKKTAAKAPAVKAAKPAGSARSQPFELRRSKIQGTGAFATRAIRRGQRVVEYQGEKISNSEATRRYDETKMGRHHTFLFTVDAKTVIDGASQGNDAIYINHSCDANCEAVNEDGRIWIFATRAIQPGEELGYDYQYQRTGDAKEDAEMEKFYACRCGAATCRGSILTPAKKKRVAAKKPAAKKTAAKKTGAKKAPAAKKSAPGKTKTAGKRTA